MKHFILLVSVAALAPLASVSNALAQDAPEQIGAPVDQASVEQIPKANRPARSNSARMSIAPAGLLFASFDQNGDYQIDSAEIDSGIAAAFARADKNANGIVSLVELDRWRISALGSLDLLPGNTQFDRDFNSSVTAAEFDDVLRRTSIRLDADDDLLLSFSELLTRPRAVQKERSERQSIFGSARNDRGQRGQRR